MCVGGRRDPVWGGVGGDPVREENKRLFLTWCGIGVDPRAGWAKRVDPLVGRR